MFDNQVRALTAIIQDEDIRQYAGDGFENLIKAVVLMDMGAGFDAVKELRSLLLHVPTALFWDKMRRFMYGTFRCREDQVKLVEKFKKSSDEYYAFVKKQVALVDSMDEEEKIDYFAQLTRCFIQCEIDNALYFKLVYLIKNCTVDELKYLAELKDDVRLNNSLWVSILSLQGLFVQEQDSSGKTWYVLSDIGKYLKLCGLNFDEGIFLKSIKKKYEELTPLPQLEPASQDEIDGILGE